MQKFVLDSSIALAWCFEDEHMASTAALYDSIDGDSILFVPTLWTLEITNTFAVALKRKRVTEDEIDRYFEALSNLPIRMEPLEGWKAFSEILPLAKKHELTTYDAAYLDLARRKQVPLQLWINCFKKRQGLKALAFSIERTPKVAH